MYSIACAIVAVTGLDFAAPKHTEGFSAVGKEQVYALLRQLWGYARP